jgi:hypothetical protein
MSRYKKSTPDHPRDYWLADKSRTLGTVCEGIKHGFVRMFAYDYVSPDQPGLVHDFLALMQEKIDSRTGDDIYVVIRNKLKSDDFAQSVNLGAIICWQKSRWPNFAEVMKYELSLELASRRIDPDFGLSL